MYHLEGSSCRSDFGRDISTLLMSSQHGYSVELTCVQRNYTLQAILKDLMQTAGVQLLLVTKVPQ